MRRRQLLQGAATAILAGSAHAVRHPSLDCGCAFQAVPPAPAGAAAFERVGSRLRVTGMKVFGVSLNPQSDRPYVFVKLETNQGLVGWGEGTLEGKAGAVIACMNDFRDFVIGADPMQVEHIWQSMYVHSFYRAGPVIGSAISGIDQALWDIRGKALGMPVYKLLGGPFDSRGIRGYYHADGVRTPDQLKQLRATAIEQGVSCFKTGPSGYYEWIDTHARISRTVQQIAALREGLGPDIDIAVDFHAKTSPSVASVIIKELEPLNLLWVEEPCPPENVKAMARIARRSTVPIATGERLVASYGVREIVEMGVVDILQTDINHVGGVSALFGGPGYSYAPANGYGGPFAAPFNAAGSVAAAPFQVVGGAFGGTPPSGILRASAAEGQI